MVQMMRQNGIAVVVDMDDDMSKIHPDNIAFHTYRHRTATPLSWKWALESCKRATFVTTTTRALQREYARHGRGMIIQNYVPEKCLTYDKPDTGNFGWAGTTKSHPNDLQVTGQTVQHLINEGERFRVVGGKSKVKECLRLAELPQATGSIELNRWIRVMAETYDVGMIPLAPTAFNAAKSNLKGKEHMAAGIPFVYSPREDYRVLAKASGCGIPAESPRDWYTQLKRLLTDEILRKEQADMGKQFMMDQTYQKQAWRWMTAWEEAYRLQRGSAPSA
jgi:hypothetical protein